MVLLPFRGEILGTGAQSVADGSITLVKMASQSVDEDNLYISNAGSNGQFLSKQSGNNGGLTWAAAGFDGNLTGGQLTFPASQSASAGVNVLDDYEEGTATITMGDDNLDGTGESQVYAIQVFHYQKVGNRVSYGLQLRVTDTASLNTGQTVNVLGLPFPSNSTTNTHNAVSVGFADSLGLTTASETLTGRIQPNTSYIQMFIWAATAGTSVWVIGEVSSHGQFVINGDYRV